MSRGERVGVVGTLWEKARGGEILSYFKARGGKILSYFILLLHTAPYK